MSRFAWLVATLAFVLTGCSGTTRYVSNAEKNLFISTDTESGFLSGVDASLDIYSFNEQCETRYLGTVALGNSAVQVGVETGEPVQLVFNFASSSFLANAYSSTGYDVLLYPEFGHHYDIQVSYRDDIYNVEISERPRGVSEGVAMSVRREAHDCQSQAI